MCHRYITASSPEVQKGCYVGPLGYKRALFSIKGGTRTLGYKSGTKAQTPLGYKCPQATNAIRLQTPLGYKRYTLFMYMKLGSYQLPPPKSVPAYNY